MNRGSPLLVGAVTASELRFNEAPIHESGKCLRTQGLEPVDKASMRPRFMNRGSLVGPALALLALGLLQ